MKSLNNNIENETDGVNDDEQNSNDRPSKQQALDAIELLKYYFHCDEEDTWNQINHIHQIEMDIKLNAKKHSKICDYFKLL